MKKILYLFLCIHFITNKAFEITFIPRLTFSHYALLKNMAFQLQKINPHIEIKFINIKTTKEKGFNIEKTIENNISFYSIAHESIHSMPEKINLLLPHLIPLVKNTDLIIHDSFSDIISPLLGEILDIKTIAITNGNDFGIEIDNISEGQTNNIIDTNSRHYYNLQEVDIIRKTFNVSLPNLIKSKTIYSQYYNICNGYPLFVQSIKVHDTRLHDKNTFFAVQENKSITSNFTIPKTISEQKIIYIAFGSHIGKKKHHAKFINKIFESLIQDFGNNNKYIFIIGNTKNIQLTARNVSNFYFYENMIPQIEILKKADLFITHCGINSINEAIQYEVPMIAIPFTNEQIVGANKIEQTKIGIYLKNDNTVSFKESILKILDNPEPYKENIKKIKEIRPQSFAEIIEEIIKEIS